MRRALFQPSIDGEARILLLIHGFSSANSAIEGRTKLAKLDFLLRNPAYLQRAIRVRTNKELDVGGDKDSSTIEHRMVRYRYGPWDPAYFALLGRLVGKRLVVAVPVSNGIGYRTTDEGATLSRRLAETDAWAPVQSRVSLLAKHLNLTGTNLKRFVYDNFPEVVQARWGESL